MKPLKMVQKTDGGPTSPPKIILKQQKHQEEVSTVPVNSSHQHNTNTKKVAKPLFRPVSMIPRALQCRWGVVKRNREQETIILMGRKNYKIADYLGFTRLATTRIIVVLNMEAVPSFIKHSLLPYEPQKRI